MRKPFKSINVFLISIITSYKLILGETVFDKKQIFIESWA
jgi:hypothetical protein